MSSLSDFAKNYKPKEKIEKAQDFEELRKNFSEEENQKIDDSMKKTWEKYENMNSTQLYEELFQEAGKLKANGQFDYDTLSKAIYNMEAFLSKEQQDNMLKLLQKLR